MSGRGEFTRKFDREILGDASVEQEERVLRQRQVADEERALEEQFEKILGVLDYRAQWLRERFPGCRQSTGKDFRGLRFEFLEGEAVKGWLEFRTRLTDTQQGILVQSYMQIDGVIPAPRYDYVTFPKEKVHLDRVKRFLESKLLEFAGSYRGPSPA